MIIHEVHFGYDSWIEYDTERKFQIDFDEFESNRMYPPTNADRMSRAEFILYKRKQIFQRRVRKES